MTTTNITPLTIENVRDGLVVMEIAHPEWGEKVVTHDRNGWIQKNDRGTAMLFESEFRFWRLVE